MTTHCLKWLIGFITLSLTYHYGYTQAREIHVHFTETPIKIDGILAESAWQDAPFASSFTQHFPNNGDKVENTTEVKLLFDKRFLYISASCKQDPTKEFVVQSLKRDFEFLENDAFEIYIDAFTDANSGYSFGVNPFGVQRDGIIPNGGIKGIDLTWDGRWFAEVSRQVDGWVVEMAIPFKTLRFNQEITAWKINFSRNAFRHNEISTWVPITRGFSLSTLAFMGDLIWDQPPSDVNQNVSLIPYLAAKTEKQNTLNRQTIPLTGMDMKVGVNSSFHMDFTINPDFSQVDVDQQIIDLNRFELFFPEKRLFFLENSDLFTNLGNSRVRPFFSRRIGGLNDVPVPIVFGGRVSGKMGKTWKVGWMDVQTKSRPLENISAQNYMVATAQKSIFAGSNITAFLVNRQTMNDLQTPDNDFSRIGGIELDYRSADSKITGKSFIHYSMSPGNPKNSLAYSAKARYRTKTFSFFLGMDAAGENYIPDMGYVPRLYHNIEEQDTSIRVSYIENRANGYYRFFLPKNKTIDYLGTELRLQVFTDPRFTYQEHDFTWNVNLALINQSLLTLSYSDYTQLLYFPFTLTGLDRAFPAGNYNNKRFECSYDTGKRQALNGKVTAGYYGEFMGKRLNLAGELNYRYFRYVALGLNLSYQTLHDFPSNYGTAEFTLVGSQLELSFNRNLFLTTFLQYNTQLENFNINTRFNWRFHPLSDLFIVYTSNYLPENFYQKNEALVVKLNYWLNL